MTPPKAGDNNPQAQPSRHHGTEAWSQRDLDDLHDMVQDYRNAKWFRRQAKWWAIWVLGLPAAAVAFWEPLLKLIKLLRGH